MFRTRAEVLASLVESLATGLVFLGTGVMLVGFLGGFVAILQCMH
jgi:hypothetical protein